MSQQQTVKLLEVTKSEALIEILEKVKLYVSTTQTEIIGVERATRTHAKRIELLTGKGDAVAVAQLEEARQQVALNTSCIAQFKEHIVILERAITALTKEIRAAQEQPATWKLTDDHAAAVLGDFVSQLEEAHSKGPPQEGAFPGVRDRLHARRAVIIAVIYKILEEKRKAK
jgi:hypothetical protein